MKKTAHIISQSHGHKETFSLIISQEMTGKRAL
jgi:hypothetical protein